MRSTITNGIVMCVAAAAAASLAGCGKRSGGQEAGGSGPTVALSGKVLSPTLKPVKGATVKVVKEYSLTIGEGFSLITFIESVRTEPAAVAEGKTSEDGSFTVNVPEGDYCVQASAPGLSSGSAHFVRAKNGAPGAEVVLENAHSLSGKVVDAEGKPIEGASLVLIAQPDRREMEAGRFVFDRFAAVSGKNGEFSFTGLRADRYAALVEKAGLPSKLHDRMQIPSDEEARIEYLKGFEFKGKVSDSEGKPVKGAKVLAFGNAGGGFGETATSDDGSYAIGNLHPGGYRLVVRAPGLASAYSEQKEIKAGAIIEKSFTLNPAMTIKGKVVGSADKKGLAGVIVYSPGSGDEALFGGQMSKAVSGQDGAFTIENPAVEVERKFDRDGPKETGKFNVRLRAIAEGMVLSEQVRVEVEQKQKSVEGVIVEMTALPVVAGKALDKDGKPISGAAVHADDTDRESGMVKTMLGLKDSINKTGEDGSFRVFAPAGQRKTMLGVFPENGQFGIWVGPSLEQGSEKKDVEIRIPEAGSIEGKVSEEGTKPLSGLKVELKYIGPEGKDEELKYFIPGRWKAGGKHGIRTDEGGAFAVQGLAPGVWEVVVEAPEYPRGKVLKVKVEGGKSAKTEISKSKPLTISGFVVDGQGEPVEGADVSASMTDGEGSGSAKSDKEGKFSIRNLAKGKYKIRMYKEEYAQNDPAFAEAGANGVKIEVVKY